MKKNGKSYLNAKILKELIDSGKDAYIAKPSQIEARNIALSATEILAAHYERIKIGRLN